MQVPLHKVDSCSTSKQSTHMGYLSMLMRKEVCIYVSSNKIRTCNTHCVCVALLLLLVCLHTVALLLVCLHTVAGVFTHCCSVAGVFTDCCSVAGVLHTVALLLGLFVAGIY